MTQQINILIAPDKMKGTLTAKQICEVFERVSSHHRFVDSKGRDVIFNCTSQPLADGGDGSLDVMKDVIPLERVVLSVKGPLMESLESHYFMDDEGAAYIEMAAASGLVQVPLDKRNCMNTTSYGFGELIRHAINNNIKRIYLFLGGSATCDGGMGMASALGYQFKDQNGNLVPPFGGQMQHVRRMEESLLLEKIRETEIITLHDVNNTILGKEGAAPAFAPQKGANQQEVKILEWGLKNMVNLMLENTTFYKKIQPYKKHQRELETLIGGGAAGGMGLGTHYFLGAHLIEGTSEIMKLTKFHEKIQNQNIVITGEGQIDATTLNGKVPFGVSKEAQIKQIPCYVVGGNIKLNEAQRKELGATKLYSLSDQVGKTEAIQRAEEVLAQIAKMMLDDIAFAL